MSNQHLPLSPADLAKPFVIHVNSMPFWGPGPPGTPETWKFSENGGIPRNSTYFGEFHQKAPETAFSVKIHPETHFSVPGTPKKA